MGSHGQISLSSPCSQSHHFPPASHWNRYSSTWDAQLRTHHLPPPAPSPRLRNHPPHLWAVTGAAPPYPPYSPSLAYALPPSGGTGNSPPRHRPAPLTLPPARPP